VRRLLPIAMLLLIVEASCDHRDAADQPANRVSVSTDGVTVIAEVSDLEVSVVERLDFLIEVSHEPSLSVELPEIGEQLGDFMVRDRFEEPRLLRKGQAVRRLGATLEPFLPGEYEIPELAVSVQRGELTERIPVNPPRITVKSVLDGTAEQASIGEPAGIVEQTRAASNSLLWPIVGGVALLATLVAALVWLVVSRRPPPPPVDPVLAGLAELEEIHSALDAGEIDARAATTRVARILRSAVAERLERHAPSMTGHEIAHSRSIRTGLGDPAFDCLQRLCHWMDEAAYAPRVEPDVARSMVAGAAQVLSYLLRAPVADSSAAESTRTVEEEELAAL